MKTIFLQLLLLGVAAATAISRENKQSLDTVISDSVLPDEFKSKVLSQPTKNLLDVPWWLTFITNLINTFNGLSSSESNHFGFMYMANINNLDEEFGANFNPQDDDGKPIIQETAPISPPDIKLFGNYVMSNPGTHSSIYAEDMLLDHLDNLLAAYEKQFKETPNFILHYSRTLPDKMSLTNILNRLNRPPYNKVAYKVVAYTLSGEAHLADLTLGESKDNKLDLSAENLVVYHQQCVEAEKGDEPLGSRYTRGLQHDGSLSLADAVKLIRESLLKEKRAETEIAELETCKADDTLQGCFSDCMDELLTCDCESAKKHTSVAAIINEFTFSCARSNFGDCTLKWVEDNIGQDEPCINQEKLNSLFTKCTPKCSGKPLSNPLDPKNSTNYPGVLRMFADLANFHRPEGSDLCSNGNVDEMKRGYGIKQGYTAGNTPCRSGHGCSYYGYSYKWCYTSFDDHWDYCCTSGCGRLGYSYEWCHSGGNWQKCGGGGIITARNTPCISKYLCGLHRDVKSSTTKPWCYIDYFKNWEYC